MLEFVKVLEFADKVSDNFMLKYIAMFYVYKMQHLKEI